eukprot:SAG31_NODE_3881_length_3789_cov_2.824390_4_plen_104_part_00
MGRLYRWFSLTHLPSVEPCSLSWRLQPTKKRTSDICRLACDDDAARDGWILKLSAVISAIDGSEPLDAEHVSAHALREAEEAAEERQEAAAEVRLVDPHWPTL